MGTESATGGGTNTGTGSAVMDSGTLVSDSSTGSGKTPSSSGCSMAPGSGSALAGFAMIATVAGLGLSRSRRGRSL